MNIKNFEHLMAVPEIKFKQEGDVIIASYMIANDALWNMPLAKECRGITFNSDGDIICRPFEKFWNLNERPETQLHIIQGWDWDKVFVWEKRDGSMVSPVLVGDTILWKTKKSFVSDVALDCQAYAQQLNIASDGIFYMTIKRMALLGQTLIFEYTSPDNKIVIDYGKEPKLTLLAVRDNHNGWYYDPRGHACQLGVNLIPTWDKTLDEILFDVDNKKDFEGYVLFNTDTQERVKIKTTWYLQMHRVNTEIRERDIVEMILDETIDDVKSLIVSEGMDMQPILEIEKRVVELFDFIVNSTTELAKIGKNMIRKEFAIAHKENPFFGLAIKEIDGKEPDYKGYFKRNKLQLYSLRCVYNKNF